MSIASNLRRAMDENGLSAAALARAIDAEAASVRRWMSGVSRPNDAVLSRIEAVIPGWTAEEIRYGKSARRSGKLTTDEVSRYTGIDPLSLRVGLQRGIWPFGTAYKRPGSTKYTYEYNPVEVMRWTEAQRALREGGNETREPIPGTLG